MRITFSSESLRDTFNTEKKLKKKLGAKTFGVLSMRMADLGAAPNVQFVIEKCRGRCEPLFEDRSGQFSIRLDGRKRLVFVPDHEPLPLRPDGSINPTMVTQIRIVEVTDYHDGGHRLL
jgi:toxin HigB-1